MIGMLMIRQHRLGHIIDYIASRSQYTEGINAFVDGFFRRVIQRRDFSPNPTVS